jgi:hypothetical protein
MVEVLLILTLPRVQMQLPSAAIPVSLYWPEQGLSGGSCRQGELPRIPQPVESRFADGKVFLGFPRITNIKRGWADDASVRD